MLRKKMREQSLKPLIRRLHSCYFKRVFSLSMGVWLSWLERRVHIAEIAGSIPAAPIFSFV